MEQMEELKAQGASEQELNDPAVADLALRKIFEAHFDEIRPDPELTDETFAIVSTPASPEELREISRASSRRRPLCNTVLSGCDRRLPRWSGGIGRI